MELATGRQRNVAATVVESLAAACSLTALIAAAANAIPLAIAAFEAFCACAVVRVLLFAYQILPSEEQNAFVSRRAVRRTIVTSCIAAAVVACAYWWIAWVPLDGLPPFARRWMLRLWPKLDYIPAAFSLLLPIGWRSGLHQYFRDGTYCFPGPYWWAAMRYLRTAIPAYAIAFTAGITLLRLFGTVWRCALPWPGRTAREKAR